MQRLWDRDDHQEPSVFAPFAVLVAEEVFASGGKLLVSVTSAGQPGPTVPLPCTILVHRALRGEGTSYTYFSPDDCAAGDTRLLSAVSAELQQTGIDAIDRTTWTTDAPFRETQSAVATAQAAGAQAVEMEIAALCAFAQACQKPVVCFALVTNQMTQAGDYFEKGADNGASHALTLVAAISRAWSSFTQDSHHQEREAP